MSDRLLLYVVRRLGMQTLAVAKIDIPVALKSWPVIALTKSGFCFLLFEVNDGNYTAALPGYPGTFHPIPFDSELLQQISNAYAVRMDRPGPAFPRIERNPKLWLLPWLEQYRGVYDASVLSRHEEKYAASYGKTEQKPISLTELTSSALLTCHASVYPKMPESYGCYRDLNLKRGDTVFIQHTELDQVVDNLLTLVRASNPGCLDDVVKFSARLFSDFLAVHPFFNANQRMAILLVSKYLERWNLNIQWNNINSSQYYYWMRCATRGHISFLERGFQANLISLKR
ncbi:MAG: Fic family protein [Pseudomonadota bacterium]